ncbi:ninja-family protein AFP1-like [Syzygium oleosum]|uniref:ninja-family protein AFP1-like n=1 Tax=Syzygium oleosum TaxID=219896 RepID=UPI0024B8D2A6|nr:ninja-family protein AFP1-like [Syzygium oleosum]
MDGKDQHGNWSYDDQVNSTTSVLSDGGPQNPLQGISQEPPKEIQFFEIAPPAEELVDLNLELSLGGLYREIKESPNPNPVLLTATRAAAVNNANPPIMSAQNNDGILPPPPQPQPPPPLRPYYTTDNNNMDQIALNEIATYLEAQKKRQVETYRRYILRRRARERTKVKKKAAAAASPPAPPLAAAAAAAAQPPQGPLPKPTALPVVVALDTENRELSRAVEKMNALGESSGKKILEGASALATGIGSSSSQELWTSHQPNSDTKAFAAKVIYGKSAIVIENISHDEQIKRPRLFNVVQNNNAHKENSIVNGGRGMKQLLTVTTTGDGSKGKKVDGFLYKYGKGDHIFIMCFCHGVFLSPTDFVKHANHTDWSNPMKHIAVTSPPPL